MGMCGRAVGDDVMLYTMLVEGIVECGVRSSGNPWRSAYSFGGCVHNPASVGED